MNIVFGMKQTMQDGGGHSFSIALSHCSLELTSSILMSLEAKLPLTPNLMLSPFHSNFLLSLRLNRYVLLLSHLFRISGYWWIVYPEEQCKLNFLFRVCKEVILKFWSKIYLFFWLTAPPICDSKFPSETIVWWKGEVAIEKFKMWIQELFSLWKRPLMFPWTPLFVPGTLVH